MSRYSNNTTIPRALIVVISIIVIVIVVAAVRALLFTDNKEKVTELSQAEISRKALLSEAVDSRVSMVVRGPIVADEDFASYQITVTPTSRSLVIYSGYLDKERTRKDYGNNTPAYREFVNALDKANFAKGTPFEGEKDKTEGICSRGSLYEFEIANDEGIITRLWTSTCKGSKGSLDASVGQLHDLFKRQIPDADTILRQEKL